MTDETSYCGVGRTKIYTLMDTLSQAIIKNDANAIEQAKIQLKEYRELCGSLLSDEQIKSLVGTQSLEPTERTFIENAPQIILRSLTDGNLRESIRTFDAFRHYITLEIKRVPEGFIAMLESAFQRSPEPSDFKQILTKHFNREEPDFHAKATAHNQEPAMSFFRYHNTPQYKQKTNREIQQEIKNRREQKNE